MEVLKQAQYRPMAIEDQVLIFYALINRHLADVEVNRVLKFQKDFIKYVDTHAPEIREEIRTKGEISSDLAKNIDKMIAEVKVEYNYS